MLLKHKSIEANKYGCQFCQESKVIYLSNDGKQGKPKFYKCEYEKCPYFQSNQFEVECKIYAMSV